MDFGVEEGECLSLKFGWGYDTIYDTIYDTRQIDLALHCCEFAVIPFDYTTHEIRLIAFLARRGVREIGIQYNQTGS